MCGILCGESQNPSFYAKLPAALRTLGHRGPDGSDSVAFGDVFLGHTRLAIVDVSHGSQPLYNEDQSVFASVNGEFYDFESIRDSLLSKGHVFRTHSDSEILLHLYEGHGTDCLQFLHGEFAFALYDKNRRRWFCARDRMGVRPLQYYHQGRDFLVASEAKALLALGVPAKLNRENVWFSQHLQYLPQAGTLFDGIQSVRPAHFLLVDEQGAHEHEYWQINKVPEQALSFESAKEQAAELLRQAVARRVPNEVSWACHLSGGIDSSVVSALAQLHPGSGHCFTVKFTDDAFYDESAGARATAQHIGAQLHEVPVSFEAVLGSLPDAIYHAEGLSINGHLGAKYLLNKAIREAGFKVALSGEGADEIFMGYSHLKQDYLSANALSGMERQYLTGVQLPDGHTLDLSAVQQQLGFVPTWLAAKSSMAFKLRQLWAKDFRFAGNPYVDFLRESQAGKYPVSPLKQSSSLWMRYCLSGYILKVLDDAQAMAHGIEGRLPFLDTALVEFLWSVPDALYFHEGVEKGLLRQGFQGDLPASVVQRPKQSFMSPPMHWALKQAGYRNTIKGWLLDNPAFARQGMFDPAALEAFLTQCETQDSPGSEPILMTLISLALFCEKLSL